MQLGLMAMGVVDTLVVGRVSAQAIAGVALGNIYVITIAMLAVGVLMGLDPILSQAVGAGDDRAYALGVQRGVLLAVLMTVPISLLLLPAEGLLRALGQRDDVVPLAAGYVRASIVGILPFLGFVVMRQALQARHRLAPIVWVIILANAVNGFLDWVFVFGHLGVPAMGAVGTAHATAIARWLMALGLIALTWRELSSRHLRWRVLPLSRDALAVQPLVRVLKLGVPIGFQIQLEYGVFAVVGLLMGRIGAVQMAGHQIALNLASLTYMMPLGVSVAASVLVGNAIGAGDAPEARRAARASLLLGIGVMVLTCAVMLAAPSLIARAYTTDAAVIAVAAALIPLAGLFQVFDGTQVVSIGILRGAGDTRAPMLVNLVGYWVFALPVAWWLGLRRGMGPAGLWWGLVLGLIGVAAVLVLRVRHRMAGPLARL